MEGKSMDVNKKIAAVLAAACCSAAMAFAASRDVDKEVFSKYAAKTGGAQSEWGALNCHDPKIFQDDDGTYYVYSTDAAIGGAGQKGLQIRSSKDLVHWTSHSSSAIGRNWDRTWLKWVNLTNANASSWAPTVIKQNGLYYMFHGIITDSRNPGYPDAAITLAIASNPLGPFFPAAQAAKKNSDIGKVLKQLGVSYKQSNLVRYCYYDRSYDLDADESVTDLPMYNTGTYDTQNETDSDFNSMSYGFGCIDPEFIIDVSTGKLMTYTVGSRTCYGLTYGSWKGGIALMYVDSVSLKPVDRDGKELDDPADSVEGAFGVAIGGGYGAAYEGAQVIYNSENGWYYLFVSMGDLDWDYRVGVGRSKNVAGPYLDASGTSMLLGPMNANEFHAIGGKIMGAYELKDGYSFRAQGGESILRTNDGKIVMATHARTNFLPGYFFFLQIHQMFFTKDGWPVLNGNEYYNDYNGKDESLAALTVSDIAGTYDAILTERGTEQELYKHFAADAAHNISLKDGIPTKSKDLTLNADGTIGGKNYGGTWTLGSDGCTVTFELKDGAGNAIGTFTGYVLNAVDWSRKKGNNRRTVTFTTIDATTTGEFFWGNRRDGKK